MDEPTQTSLARLRRFDVRPNRKLGQNFLIDNNILRVIAERAELSGGDVVLEVGGGLGVLSEYLAERVAHVHVVEIDEHLRPALEDAVGARANVTIVFADAVDLNFAELDPAPSKLIANLPYGVAASTVIKAFYELPGLRLACVMAQREVAQRLTAAPGGKLYGASSVLAQAVAGDTSMRKLSRNIFFPVPNVDSALVTLRRTAQTPDSGFVELVHDAFSHRRKPLPGSLALARRGRPGAERVKQRAAAALERIGHDPAVRAERLSAEDFRRLYAELERRP
ncbi:MAG: ribosomal RNA small subunit methyltransferase A [Thermoleophilia bacterium]|nr:ribosomal RNA small subunit methyltransferase A [Thermoleophilia bacterium]